MPKIQAIPALQKVVLGREEQISYELFLGIDFIEIEGSFLRYKSFWIAKGKKVTFALFDFRIVIRIFENP